MRNRHTAAAIESALEAGELERAVRELDEAEASFGDGGPFPELRRRVETVREHTRIAALLEKARRLADAQQFSDALEAVISASSMAPNNTSIGKLRRDIEAAEEKFRQAREVQEAQAREERELSQEEVRHLIESANRPSWLKRFWGSR